jgi:(2Fe-2S) ferredoxin
MREVTQLPRLHLFVCANHRAADAPLGPGCGKAGEGVYAALKDEVAGRRAFQTIWVTQTQCLGVCPRQGATVAIYSVSDSGGTQTLLTEVNASDVPGLFATVAGAPS